MERIRMHTNLEKHQPGAELKTDEAPIYLPPVGDSLESWRDLPYKRESWVELLTYWVNELHWRRSFWNDSQR
jgi:hypothetical protein